MTEDKDLLFSMLLKTTCQDIYKDLGKYHREFTYRNCIDISFSNMNMNCIKEYPLKIKYKNVLVNTYYIDLVYDNIPIEIKTINKITEKEKCQIKNYIRYLNSEKGYLVNFGYKELTIIEFSDNNEKVII